jgi:hypothetical protein
MEEPVFTLRAQDVLADIAVQFWVRANGLLRERIQHGASIPDVRFQLRLLLDRELPLNDTFLDVKLNGALACASDMAKWPNQKLAD